MRHGAKKISFTYPFDTMQEQVVQLKADIASPHMGISKSFRAQLDTADLELPTVIPSEMVPLAVAMLLAADQRFEIGL